MPGSLRFYGDGIISWVVFSQSFWLRVLPGGALLVQPRWMQERRILGSGRTCGISFWTFLNSSGWWWLINSVLLTRTSCGKITHTNDYYGAWPGWAVSVSVPPLRTHTKWSKRDQEKQILYVITYMWSLKSKLINKLQTQEQIDGHWRDRGGSWWNG